MGMGCVNPHDVGPHHRDGSEDLVCDFFQPVYLLFQPNYLLFYPDHPLFQPGAPSGAAASGPNLAGERRCSALF